MLCAVLCAVFAVGNLKILFWLPENNYMCILTYKSFSWTLFPLFEFDPDLSYFNY